MSIIPQLLLEGHSVRLLNNSYWKTTLGGGYGCGTGRGIGNGSGSGGGGSGIGFGGRNGIGISRAHGYRESYFDSDGYTVDGNIREQIIYIVEE